jgi:hypothetical protein
MYITRALPAQSFEMPSFYHPYRAWNYERAFKLRAPLFGSKGARRPKSYQWPPVLPFWYQQRRGTVLPQPNQFKPMASCQNTSAMVHGTPKRLLQAWRLVVGFCHSKVLVLHGILSNQRKGGLVVGGIFGVPCATEKMFRHDANAPVPTFSTTWMKWSPVIGPMPEENLEWFLQLFGRREPY